MVRYGAVLSPNALSRLQDPFYSFGKAEPFGISFEGRTRSFRCPGQFCCGMVPLYTLITGKGLKIPMTSSIIRERGVFLLKENGETLEEVDFVPRPAFLGKRPAGEPPWRR